MEREIAGATDGPGGSERAKDRACERATVLASEPLRARVRAREKWSAVGGSEGVKVAERGRDR
jgi:hypothetical protein